MRKKSSARERPLLPFQRIKRLLIFHNGRVYNGLALGFHHCVLVAITARKSFILLELELVSGGIIGIRVAETTTDLKSVLRMRLNKQVKINLWDIDRVDASTDDLQLIINKYHGKRYDLFHLNCRTFVNEMCRKCSSKKSCGYLDRFLF